MLEEDSREMFSAGALVDTLIISCNEAVKAVIAGEYVHFCGIIVDMVQRLSALKDGIAEQEKMIGGGDGV